MMRRCNILTVKVTCVFIIEARFLKASEDESCRSLVNVLRCDRKDTLSVTTADMMLVVSGAAAVDVAGGKVVPVVEAVVVATVADTVVDVGDSVVEGTGVSKVNESRNFYLFP